jgi:hypothetical protein
MYFIETSVKDNYNIEKAFIRIAEVCIDKEDHNELL